MKQHVEVIKDSFVDYAGKTHHFVIAAVSEMLESENSDSLLVMQVEGHNGELIQSSLVGYVEKGVRIGISICNPEDKFDEKVGTLKAIARARNSGIALYAADRGYINTALVRAFLQQEAEHLKNNPDMYIQGYNDAKARYLKKKGMEELKGNFSEVERIIVDSVQKDPKYLDNVNKYLTWLKNQEQGKKCKKSGK